MARVVELQYPEKGIALIRLEDREYRNTFSSRLIEGLMDVFAQIRNDLETKVVVVHGYDTYFCCGGTKEEITKIYKGKAKFTDFSFYRLLLDCEVPTISAMQGHALGGGLVFGCYADIIVLSKECIYSANFMRYGFTPGLGATYIIPKKIGSALGSEMLLSAKNYYGEELRERGVSAKVVSKKETINTALSLARELADKPLISLKILKERLTHQIKKELPGVIEEELRMHEISFAQEEVKKRIETLLPF